MMAQSIGIQGFPALVVGDESNGLAAVTVGYQDYDAIAPLIARWLDEQGAD